MPAGISKSSASDQKIIVTDEGQVAARGGVQSNPYSTAVGQKAKLNTGIELKNVKGDVVLGVPGSEVLTLTGSITEQFTDALREQNAAQAAALEAAMKAQAAGTEDALAKIAALGETRATGGESNQQKTFLWLVLGGLALLAFFIRRR